MHTKVNRSDGGFGGKCAFFVWFCCVITAVIRSDWDVFCTRIGRDCGWVGETKLFAVGSASVGFVCDLVLVPFFL